MGTTRFAGPAAARPADLVDRQFGAARPNELWLVGFTYVPTWNGMAFTAFVFDAGCQRIMRWRTAAAMPTQLLLDALDTAVWAWSRAGEDVTGVVHHSDAGSQYTSIRYTSRLLEAGAVPLIDSVETVTTMRSLSLIGLHNAEGVRPDGPWRGVDELELGTLTCVHWFNEVRLHDSLGYVSPIKFEEHFKTTIETCQ